MTYRIQPVPVTVVGRPAGTVFTPEEKTAFQPMLTEHANKLINLYNKSFELGKYPLFVATDGIVNKDNPNEILTNYKSFVTAIWTEDEETFITTAAGHTISLAYTLE